MDWLKDVLSSVLDRVKALFTGNWAGDPRVAQALLGYAAILTVGCVVSASLFALGVTAGAVVAYSVVKEMWRGDKLVLPEGGAQTLLSEASHYLIGCGIGAAVVVLL